MQKSIVLCGNTAWGMLNFRKDLIQAFLAQGHTVTVLAPPASEADEIESLGARFVPVTIHSKGKNPISELRSAYEIFSTLKRLSPHIVFSFTIKSVSYCGVACRLLNIQHVPTITGMGSAFITRSWVTHVAISFYKISCAKARTVFFLNESDKEFFLEARIVSPDNARIIPGEGIDVDHFSPSGESATRVSGKFRFLYCGRVLAEKGFLELIDAAKRLKSFGLQVEVHVVGFADWANPSAIREDQLQNWEDEGLIIFHGPTKDVRPYIWNSDCIVLPSYREGLSRILLEAAAMECPMIASDVPGCKEIVRDGITGYLCAARDAESLAATMKSVAELPQERIRQLGVNARKLIIAEFSSAEVSRRYLSLMN